MVKLICFLKRKPGMTPEAFHEYWRQQHGPLVASTNSGKYIVRYEQNHRPVEDYRRTGASEYDGVTEQWFRSLDDFNKSLAEEDYRLIAEDIPKFLDTGALVWIMTEEPEVVIDRPVNG